MLFNVSLMLKGEDLQPDLITSQLNVIPSYQMIKGQLKPRSSKYFAKIGVWCLKSQSKSENVDDHLDDIFPKLKDVHLDMGKLDGVEEAFVDLFCATSDENDNIIASSIRLDVRYLKRIRELGLSVMFTS